VFPLVVTNKGEGIRRLIDEHHLKAVISLGDDVSDTNAFRMLRALWTEGYCITLLLVCGIQTRRLDDQSGRYGRGWAGARKLSLSVLLKENQTTH
jgi:hypothetical protein